VRREFGGQLLLEEIERDSSLAAISHAACRVA
jgi:hypothetical protein